jgi:hypothetical protein
MALTKIVIETEIINGDQSVNQLQEIKQNAEGGVKSLSDLKKEFKILQDQLSGLTPGTKEYVDALKRLGAVKDDIGDLRAEIEGFAGADKKIQAFTSVIGGVASGFQAAQGAVALFGSENEDLQKALLKVQAAMAITQGLQGLAGMGDSLKVVSNVLKSTTVGTYALAAAQRVYNAVMAANPIGALIAGLTALVGIIALVVKSQESAIEEEKKLIAEREAEINQLKRLKDSLENFQTFETNLAKARGKTLVETRELEDKQYKDRIENLRNLKNQTQLQIDQIAAARLKADADESKELKEKQDALIKDEQSYNDEILKLIQNRSVLQSQRVTDDLKAEEEKRKEADAKAKERAKKKAEDDLVAAEKWRQEQSKFIQYEIDALNNKFGEAEQIIAEQELATKIALGHATPEEIEAWNAYKLKQEIDYQTALDTELKRLQDEQNKRREEQNAKIDKEYADEKKRREDELAMRKRNADFAIKATLESLTVAQQLTDAFAGKSIESQKKAFNIKKAASIAQATIETYLSAQSAFASQVVPGDVTSPIRGAIAAGLAIASGLARVAVISKQQFQAPSTGGGATESNLGSFSQGGGQPPQGLSAQNTVTQLNPDGTVAGQGNREMQPMKAYVVESESRAVTERVNKLSNQSKI